jgi:hypothetical protein
LISSRERGRQFVRTFDFGGGVQSSGAGRMAAEFWSGEAVCAADRYTFCADRTAMGIWCAFTLRIVLVQ